MRCNISYNKLWKLLIDKNITKTEFRKNVGFATSTLAKLNKNETISMNIIIEICKYLRCGIENIMEINYE